MTDVVLVLGGTRSGKSAVAEAVVAAADGPVTYVATAWADDPDHRSRIEAHQARRPADWTTVECPDPDRLPDVLRATSGAVLLDSLGTWVAGHRDLSVVDPGPLCAALARRDGPTVVVSDEVGLSLHAPTEVGRAFVDAMGTVNQAVAAVAGRVLLVVAGRTLEFPPGGPAC